MILRLSRFILILLLITGARSVAAETILQVGEELVYRVSYMGFSLGTIKVITEADTAFDGNRAIRTKAYMTSNDGIPFVGLKAIFKSWMSPGLSYSYRFQGNTKFMSDTWEYQEIDFDNTNSSIRFETWENKKLKSRDSIKTNSKWNDGMSLFFLSRQYSFLEKSIKVPTFMGVDTAYTIINFQDKREEVEIDAVDYGIKTKYFDGKALWEGIYGLNGYFEGWFSDDDARVPIKATMEVIVGSVDIELIHWKRKGWSPPKA